MATFTNQQLLDLNWVKTVNKILQEKLTTTEYKKIQDSNIPSPEELTKKIRVLEKEKGEAILSVLPEREVLKKVKTPKDDDGTAEKLFQEYKTKGITKENKERIKQSSFHYYKGRVYEQIESPHGLLFAYYDHEKEEVVYTPYAPSEVGIVIPQEGEEVEKKIVLLPKKAIEYQSVKELDKEIMEHIKKWLDIDDVYLRFATWNIRFSWLYDRFHTLNYTRALGDTGSGKSRFLDVLGHLHYKPLMISGALTPAPIFRILDKWKGTLLIDEGDQKDSDESNAFIKILNCGYEKGRSVTRCDKNDPNKLDFFDVYGPKVITTRQRFQDKATEARCITKIMKQTNRSDIPEILTDQYFRDVEVLRAKLLMYRFKNYDVIDPEAGLKVELKGIEPRLRQVNRGFLGLFADDVVQTRKFYLWLQDYQTQLISDRAETFEGGLINSIANLLILGHEYITPEMVAEYCNEFYQMKYQVDSRAVGRKLKPMGVEFRVKKIDGSAKRVLLHDKETFSMLFDRYVADQEVLGSLKEKGYDVTKVTLTMRTWDSQKKAKKGMRQGTHKQCNFRNFVTRIVLEPDFWAKKHDFMTKMSHISEKTLELLNSDGYINFSNVTSKTEELWGLAVRNLKNCHEKKVTVESFLDIAQALGLKRNYAEKRMEKEIQEGNLYQPKPDFIAIL
jgi:hypothetical protein